MGGHCVFVHTVWAIVMINCCFTANELRVTVSLCECLYSLSGLPLEDSGGHSNDPPVHPMNPLNSMKPSLPPNPQRYTHTNTHAAADEGLRPQVTPHLRSTVTSLYLPFMPLKPSFIPRIDDRCDGGVRQPSSYPTLQSGGDK